MFNPEPGHSSLGHMSSALEEQEEQGFEGIPQVGAWQEGQDG
ncbi:MAG: hypothetical protein RQ868_00755 [Meiothermus sp.]|nr:hypothetical protein [Meiothermus sp.]MDT7919103.1 hypothetical protein [Meiothermus sp.]